MLQYLRPAVLSGFLLFSSLAFGQSQDSESAKVFFEQAKVHYKEKNYEKALEGFQEAYRRFEDPALLFNMAQCQRLLGQFEESIKSYREFLEKVPKTPYREDIESRVKSLEELLEKTKAEAKANEPATAPSSSLPSSTLPTKEVATFATFQQFKAIDDSFDQLEALVNKSQELTVKNARRLRLVLPAGLGLGGSVFGVGAIVLDSSIKSQGEISTLQRRELIGLSLASDLFFAASAATLFLAVKKNKENSDFRLGFVPVDDGAVVLLTAEK